MCSGGGDPAGEGAERTLQAVTSACPDSKCSPTQEGSKEGVKWVEKQAKKKKSKNRKNK